MNQRPAHMPSNASRWAVPCKTRDTLEFMMNKLSDSRNSELRFITSLFTLAGGLISLLSALSYSDREFMNGWEILLAFLLPMAFGLGWWYESRTEQILQSKGRQGAMIALFGFILIFVLLSIVVPLTLVPSVFWQRAMSASGFFLGSGYIMRLSVANPETADKLTIGRKSA